MTEFLDACYDAIRKQKHAIPETIRTVDNEAKNSFEEKRQVVLTGCGDSYAVADYGRWVFLKQGINAIVVSAPDVKRLPLDKDCLVIGITASGRSISTIQALKDASSMGAETIVLTDNPKKRTLDRFSMVWTTRSLIDSYDISPSSPTTSAMAYLLKIGSVLRKDNTVESDISALEAKMRHVISWAETTGREMSEIIKTGCTIHLLADGPNYVAAQLGLMKFDEYALVRGIALLREEFQHYGALPVNKDEPVVLISDSPVNDVDKTYAKVLSEKLGMNMFHLHSPLSLGLETPLGQTIANSIAIQFGAYYHVSKANPTMSGWRKPHSGVFKIY